MGIRANPSQISNMPTGKKLDSMLDKLSAKDIKELRTQFELDVQKENQKERHWLIWLRYPSLIEFRDAKENFISWMR